MAIFFSGLFCGMFVLFIFYSFRYRSFKEQVSAITQKASSDLKKAEMLNQKEIEKQILEKEASIVSRKTALEKKEKVIKDREEELAKAKEQLKKEAEHLSKQKKEILETKSSVEKEIASIATLSKEQARTKILHEAEQELAGVIEQKKTAQYASFEKEISHRAQEMIFSALERSTQKITKECFTSRIDLPDSEKIPLLIGKEGRNIQLLEHLLQVNVIVSEDQLLICSHDSALRFIAHRALKSLLSQNTISKTQIETVVSHAQNSFEKDCFLDGKSLLSSIDPSNIYHDEVCKAVGKMRIRTTSHQNLLKHSLHVSELMQMLASELDLDIHLAKVIGFFHDIGKVVSYSYGTSHAKAGGAFLQEHLVDKRIIDAVFSHHGETLPKSPEARLIPICDRLSAKLLGNRSNEEPAFLQIIAKTEDLARSLPNVSSAWAYYGGNHIELVLRTNNVIDEKVFVSNVEETMRSIKPPVHVTCIFA